MYTSEQLDILLQETMAGLGVQNKATTTYDGGSDRYSKKTSKRNNNNSNNVSLTPAQALVIAGLLGGSLSVFSVLVDADQQINIVLTGSLKKKSNNDQLDNILAQLGKVPFDDVVAAMMRRLK